MQKCWLFLHLSVFELWEHPVYLSAQFKTKLFFYLQNASTNTIASNEETPGGIVPVRLWVAYRYLLPNLKKNTKQKKNFWMKGFSNEAGRLTPERQGFFSHRALNDPGIWIIHIRIKRDQPVAINLFGTQDDRPWTIDSSVMDVGLISPVHTKTEQRARTRLHNAIYEHCFW